MAKTTRTAQIIIEVQDKSLQELNDEIRTLEKNMRTLKIGTTEYVQANEKLGVLKNKFREATTEASKLQNVIRKTTASDQLRAIARLGQGLVGAFGGLTTAIQLLGGSTDTLEEIQTKALQFLSVMESLNSVALLFSKKNLEGLRDIGIGFTNLIKTVKAFSTATKIALASTGIGLFVVAIGAIAANWDRITGAMGRAAREKAFQKSQEGFENLVKAGEDYNKALEERDRLTQQLIESGIKYNEIVEATNLIAEAERKAAEDGKQKGPVTTVSSTTSNIQQKIEANISNLKTQIDQYTEKLDKITKDLEGADRPNVEKLDKLKERYSVYEKMAESGERFNNSQALEYRNLEKQIEKIEEKNKNVQLTIDKLITEKQTTAEILANYQNQLKLTEDFQKDRELILDAKKGELKTNEGIIRQKELELDRLRAQEDVEGKIYAAERTRLETQLEYYKILEEGGAKLTLEEQQIKAELENQLKVLDLSNQQRLKELALARERYDFEKKFLGLQDEITKGQLALSLAYTESANAIKDQSDELDLIIGKINTELELLKNEEDQYL